MEQFDQLLAMPCMSLCLYMHIGRPVVIHPYDENIFDTLGGQQYHSDQRDAAKHGQFIYLHYACSLS